MVRYVDQRLLPSTLAYVCTDSWERVVDAVRTLAVRGAPALGVAGAAALALWAAHDGARLASGDYDDMLAQRAAIIADARPTAVNLSWGTLRALSCAEDARAAGASPDDVASALFDLVKDMEREDEQRNRAIGAHGARLLGPNSRVLTHCNAGSLATVFYGTALGVIYAAAAAGNIERVYADETRPVGQGARLTSWELARAGVPVTLICDNMAASLMAAGCIDAVIVGADRIAANGDVANKIGTYGVAVLAAHHGIPFYVAAPTSTVDLSIATGADIPIEQRSAAEVVAQPIEGIAVYNPAFDVTPAALVRAIVTERGCYAPTDIAAALA